MDSFIEFNGKVFIYIEGKCAGMELNNGQRRAFENLVKSHNKGGSMAFAIIFEHSVPSNLDIILKDQFVREYYHQRQDGIYEWTICRHRDVDMITAIDGILSHAETSGIEI